MDNQLNEQTNQAPLQAGAENPEQKLEVSIVVTFIKELKSLLPKNELESFVWITKSGLFVKSDYFAKLVEQFIKFHTDKTTHLLSDEKARKKLFGDYQKDRFYLMIGQTAVLGSLVECETKDLRGIGIRLYEGLPLDGRDNIHQTDPVFVGKEGISAVLLKTGYVVRYSTKNQVLDIPFDKIKLLRDNLRKNKDVSKYLDFYSLSSFIESFFDSVKRFKKYSPSGLTVLPKQILENKNLELFRIGSSLFVIENKQILDFIPLTGWSHTEMIREELNFLSSNIRKRINGARVYNRKGSFCADLDIQSIQHHFGVSAIFSLLDSIVEHHKVHNAYPNKIRECTNVEELVSFLAYTLRNSSPIMPDKLSTTVKNKISKDCVNFLSNAGEWFFGVDRSHMVREVFYSPKIEKKSIVPINNKV